MLTEGTTGRAAAVQQDVTALHLLPLIHTHKQTNTSTKGAPHIHKYTHTLIKLMCICTYVFTGLATAFNTNRTHDKLVSIQNARSEVFDVTTVGNMEVKAAAGGIMKTSHWPLQDDSE